jgi:glutamyl-Q tRNA(Asp) synthetase
MGSLIGAVASYLDARARNGQWLLRMEDLDPPREISGAAQSILQCLQAHGLQWDGDVLWQSQRQQAYQQALQQLLDTDNAFYCNCSRSRISAINGIYDGHCRHRQTPPSQHCAVRVQVPDRVIGFDDVIQGHYQQHLLNDLGDFIIRRKDQLFAYQLAVVVDDAFQGVTDIVRGSDLLDSTPRQIHLQQLLAASTPRYAHFPVLNNRDGQKLSKQTFARAINPGQASANLLYALRFLQQPAPATRQAQHPQAILEHAVSHWDISAVARCHAMTELPNGSFACSPATQ